MAAQRKSYAEAQQRLRGRFPGSQVHVLLEVIDALKQDVDALKAWGDTLATKLNNDAGVTDTNYASTGI